MAHLHPSRFGEKDPSSSYSLASCVLLEPETPARAARLDVLRRMGLSCLGVATPEEAFQVCNQGPVRWLIVGEATTSEAGLEACARLRGLALPKYLHILAVRASLPADERIRWLDAGADVLLNGPADLLELVCQIKARTRLLEMEDRLRELTHTDPLTGVPTKSFFVTALRQEFAKVRRHGGHLTCVILDVDFFKQVNDVRGHLTGDMVLQEVSRLMQKSCRSSDAICRFGGEEFCAMLRETTEEGARIWAERLREAIAERVFTSGGQSFSVTASFGVAQLYPHMESAEQILETADMALLTAKQTGRNKVVLYENLLQTEDAMSDGARPPADAFTGYEARHAMTHVMSTLRPYHTVADAVRFFLEFRLSSAPIVDDDNHLVGILSERDLLNYVLTEDSAALPLRRILKNNVITYEENTPLKTVYEFLCRVTIRALVITREGNPTGVISRASILRWWQNVAGLHDTSPAVGFQDDSVRQKFLLSADGLVDHLEKNLARLRASISLPRKTVTSEVIGAASQIEEATRELLERCQQMDQLSLEQSWSATSGAARFVTGWHDEDNLATSAGEVY